MGWSSGGDILRAAADAVERVADNDVPAVAKKRALRPVIEALESQDADTLCEEEGLYEWLDELLVETGHLLTKCPRCKKHAIESKQCDCCGHRI